MKRPFLICIVFYSLFALLTLELGSSFFSFAFIPLLLLAIVLLTLFFVLKKRVLFLIFLITAFSFAGVFKTTTADLEKDALSKNLDGRFVIAEGRIEDYKASSEYTIFTVKCDVIDGQESKIRISVISPKNNEGIDIGKRALFKGKLEYSSDTYNKGNETFLSVFPSYLEIKDAEGFFDKIFVYVRSKVKEASVFSKNSGLFNALIIGDKSGLPKDVSDNFSKLGISHLLAISGLHLSIIVMSFYLFLNKVGIKRRITVVVSILLTFFYMSVTGFSVSVVRAGQMMIIYLITRLIRRANDSVSALFTAGFFIVAESSFALYNLSFQLSFLATLGILVFLPNAIDTYNRYIHDRKIKRNALQKITEYLIVSLYSTLSATLFTLPVILLSFNSVSLFSPIANLFAVFFAKYFLTFSFIGAVLYLSGLCFIAPIILFVADLFAYPLLAFVNFCAQKFSASFGIDVGFLLIGAVISVLVVLPFTFFSRKLYSLPLATVTLSIILAFFSIAVKSVTYDDIRVSAVYKRGCKTAFFSRGDENVLIDFTNTDSLIISSLKKVIDERRVSSIDKAVFALDKHLNAKRIEAFITAFDIKEIVFVVGEDFDASVMELNSLGVPFTVDYSGMREVIEGVEVFVSSSEIAVTADNNGNTICFFRELTEDGFHLSLYSDVLFYDGEFPTEYGNTMYREKEPMPTHLRITKKKIITE